MTSPTNWAPPFLVGVGAAVTAELGLGLLLYASAGFLPALTAVLAAELGTFAVGMSTRPRGPDASRSWRWLACAGALFLAAIAAILWGVVDQVPEGWPRGLTVTLFAALPMYTFGLVFAGLAGMRERGKPKLAGLDLDLPTPARRRSGSASDRRSTGAPAAFGATAGILLFGTLLLPRLTPVSIYMFALLCVAMAAMVEGSRTEASRHLILPKPSGSPGSDDDQRIPSIAEFAPDTHRAAETMGDLEIPPPGVWAGNDPSPPRDPDQVER